MGSDIETRLNKLEDRLSSVVDSLNKVNRTTADRVIAMEKNFQKLEARLTSVVASLNKVNQTTHDHVVKLERGFANLEKQAAGIEKMANPKEMERNTIKLVESAIKAFEKKKK
jgi:Holliday junction resolvasome RuvABC endonuclease subunit